MLYAHKKWQEMFSAYYFPRWEEFFVRLNRALDRGTAFGRKPFATDLCAWEQDWSRRHDTSGMVMFSILQVRYH